MITRPDCHNICWKWRGVKGQLTISMLDCGAINWVNLFLWLRECVACTILSRLAIAGGELEPLLIIWNVCVGQVGGRKKISKYYLEIYCCCTLRKWHSEFS